MTDGSNTPHRGKVFGVDVLLCPVEETIWSKAFIMERERYDAADIMHLILAHAEHLDWARLLVRFGPHWRVLFSHLCLFGFIYPSERDRIPEWVMTGLMDRLDQELRTPPPMREDLSGHAAFAGAVLTGCPALGSHRCEAHQRQLDDPRRRGPLDQGDRDDKNLSYWPAAAVRAGRMANRNAVFPMTTLSPSFNG